MNTLNFLQAQIPQKMSFQAVIRNSSGLLLPNQQIGIRISILRGSPEGSEMYVERHTVMTNENGLVSLEIGDGLTETGVFSNIDWSNGTFFLKTETDVTGGTDYLIAGTTQLLSVPFSLYAKKAETADYNKLTNLPLLSISNWNTAFNWGNHANAGYLKPDFENDPLWKSSPSYLITNLHIGNWNQAFSWGNHADKGYLTSLSETDPFWKDSPSFNINSLDILNWNDAYSWGNHANYGYLTELYETDPTWTGDANLESNISRMGNVGVGITDPMASLHIKGINHGKGNVVFEGEMKFSNHGDLPVEDYGTRLMWYPDKAAFRAGVISGKEWNKDSIGLFSFAVGNNVKAKGNGSYATGFSSSANTDYSSVIGYFLTSYSPYETVMGRFNKSYQPINSGGWDNYDRLFTIGNGTSFTNRSNALTILKIGHVGIGTDNPTALLHADGAMQGGGNVLFSGSVKFNNAGEPPAFGEGTRMMWYPDKGAFRAGVVDGMQWNKSNIGEFSVAAGFNTTAVGLGTVALGTETSANGSYSIAIGYGVVANAAYETALGNFNSTVSVFNPVGWDKKDRLLTVGNGITSNQKSTALTILKNGNTGIGADEPLALLHTQGNDTGEGSVLFEGVYKTANQGDPPTSGPGTRMMWYPDKAAFRTGVITGDHWDKDNIGNGSIALGFQTTASGNSTLATGTTTTASGGAATAMGSGTVASGDRSTAIGWNTLASGENSVAMGGKTVSGGEYSTATGFEATASGDYSVSMGNNTIALGDNSFASGRETMAEGNYSFATGRFTHAFSAYESVFGRYNATYTPVSLIGWEMNDHVFSIGIGTSNSDRRNALTILKNGRIGLQSVLNPTFALELPNSTANETGKARANEWATYSDKRIKSGVNPIAYGLNEIMKLQPVSYFHHDSDIKEKEIKIHETGIQDIGLIAQDVYLIIPEAVNKPIHEESDLWTMSYEKMIPVLINAIKEQQRIIDQQGEMLEKHQLLFEQIEREKFLERHVKK